MVSTRLRSLDPFMRYSVGFDRLFNELEAMTQATTQNYPPYNVIKETDSNYRIEIAVSGFSEDELEVEIKESILILKGSVQEKQNDSAFLHRGISGKDFERTFTLNADIVVVGAELVNGLLVIELEHVITEEKKPRRIDIGGSKTLPNKKKKFLAE
jgi:molecular chaperone IbpA